MNTAAVTRRRAGYRFIVVAAVMLLGITVAAAHLTGARAASFTPGARPAGVWASGDRIIIEVQTGNKNYSNHTQWVDWIYIQASTSAQDDLGCGKYEAWTQNFYQSSQELQGCGTAFYYIDRWVATGNYVCGAFTAYYTSWPRTIACIGIKV